MKKFLIFIILICFLFVGCNDNSYKVHNDTENPSRDSEATDDITYIVNISSKTYHLETCVYAENIKDENKEETKSLTALTEKGYIPCQKCIGN